MVVTVLFPWLLLNNPLPHAAPTTDTVSTPQAVLQILTPLVRCPDLRIGLMSRGVGGRRCGAGSGDGVIVDRVTMTEILRFNAKHAEVSKLLLHVLVLVILLVLCEQTWRRSLAWQSLVCM
jgi:hypothetical protein